MKPTVSVIIPTYNRCEYVQEAIDSVLAQTFRDYEVIVVDDGSSDGTGETLHARYGDEIRYEWQENQGESAARNRAIDLARGEYVAFLDSDDLWLPTKLEKQVAYLKAHPRIGMVFSEAWRIDSDGRRTTGRVLNRDATPDAWALERLCFDCPIASPSTVLIDRALGIRERFDPAIRHGEDWDLWLRLRLLTEIGMVGEPLACIRRHRNTQSYYPSASQNARRLRDQLVVLEKLFAHWPEAPAEVQRRATAWQYVKAALLQAASGAKEDSRQHLDKAVALSTALFEDGERFEKAVSAHAALVYEIAPTDKAAASIAYAKFILNAVVDKGALRSASRRRILARCYSDIGLMAHREGATSTARGCTLRALALNPSLVQNRGILSLLFEATWGKRISDLRKRLWNYLRARAS